MLILWSWKILELENTQSKPRWCSKHRELPLSLWDQGPSQQISLKQSNLKTKIQALLITRTIQNNIKHYMPVNSKESVIVIANQRDFWMMITKCQGQGTTKTRLIFQMLGNMWFLAIEEVLMLNLMVLKEWQNSMSVPK